MPATTRRLARPSALVVVSMIIGALAFAGCARSDVSSAPEPSRSGWSFTDDLGKTVTLDARPTKIAGLSDVLYSMINYGLRPVAGFGYSGIAKDQRFTSLDVTGLTEVGATYGEIDVEKLAAAAPDVIITNVYPVDASGKLDTSQPLYGFKDLQQQKQIEAIAPIITIAMKGSASEVITRTTELATALGADPAAVSAGKADFDAASQELTAAAKSGATTQVLYAEAANAYVAKPADDPSLNLYQSLGMKFTPAVTEAYYWDVISWEAYDKVGGDLVLYSERGFDKAQLMKQPTFAAGAAAKADQVYPWVFAGMDYVSQAAYMKQLAGWVGSAKRAP